jgi:hypothetical protein
MARHAVQRRIARRGPGRGVARGIRFADVRLDFNDDAAGDNASPLMNKNLPKEFAGDVEGGTIVEGTGQS